MKLLARFRKGTTPMDSLVIEFWQTDRGIEQHSMAMGGKDVRIVSEIPEEYEGMIKEPLT